MLYKEEYLNEISFPLGGIGTGCIGLAGNGSLIDWEIFNRPSKGSTNGASHFAVKAIGQDKITTKVLMGDVYKELSGRFGSGSGFGNGLNSCTMAGFPHFRNVLFDGEFPIATVKFTDEDFPAEITLTAFNPFIPLDDQNSSIPAAFFELDIENNTETELEYQIALSMQNPFPVCQNSAHKCEDITYISLQNTGAEENQIGYGDLTIATDASNATTQCYWYRGGWGNSINTYWNEFNSAEEMPERIYETQKGHDYATLIAKLHLQAQTHEKVRFLLSWNIPNDYNYWSEYKDENGQDVSWKNYYATIFQNSTESALYAIKNWDMLFARTKQFKDAIHGMSLDPVVIDAITSNLSVLKSPTVLRVEDGTLWGWEGVQQNAGSCAGTCQHVWNYAYALCFLFPKLERSIRNAELNYALDANGKALNRLLLPYCRNPYDGMACLDGQMGTVFKIFREWKISGDTDWLTSNWEKVKRIMRYAWNEQNLDKWDLNKDGVLEGRQFHTLDGYLFGPSSWLQSMYLTALKAAAEMANALGDTEAAQEFSEVFSKGYAWTNKNLFNGAYYIQKISLEDRSILDGYNDAYADENVDTMEAYWCEEKKEVKYQIQDGCALDQLLGQWHADILGLGDVFEKEKATCALRSMLQYNFKETMRNFVNPWRIFSLNDEAGAVMCDWPDTVTKPFIPIRYSNETMTGFEYAFAGLLISRGFLEEGLQVVRAVRNRYDGKKRNPWNEVECGSNYARSMASFALLPILSGFEFDMTKGYLAFAPKVNRENFRCFWSIDSGYGEYTQNSKEIRFTLMEGFVRLSRFGIKGIPSVAGVTIDGTPCKYTYCDGILTFDETIIKEAIVISL